MSEEKTVAEEKKADEKTTMGRRTIRLRRGDTRAVLCGTRARSRLHVILHDRDSLIVTCRETREVTTFLCQGGSGRRHLLTIPNNTRVIVTCRR